ncbi:acid protease [Leucogyrophana mollusca]|uniref:Acid protease n=1 Tax=Leucogyrophana mollusca TaxID=85980 RepID=A0ACB8B2Z8_9AGAM|nr:acid protease [Leucogyrophana mollusca]
MLLLPLAALTLVPCTIAVLPRYESSTGPVHVPVTRHVVNHVAELPRIVDAARNKYGYKSQHITKRVGSSSSWFDSAAFPNIGPTLGYTTQMSIGTPPQSLDVVLDTSVPYIWLATSACPSCPNTTPQFNITASSTYTTDTGPSSFTYFKYGIDGATIQGNTSYDTISLQGFTVPKQDFFTEINGAYPLNNTVSGIFGLGPGPFSDLDDTMPFFSSVSGQWSQPEIGIYFGANPGQPGDNSSAPDGVFTFGGTNPSFYKGDIEYKDAYGPTSSAWLLEVTAITVQGKSIDIPPADKGSSDGLASFDTGSTLIGVPPDVAKSIWAAVPGSNALTGEFQGMYSFPCASNVEVSFAFGGSSWPISPADMIVSGVANVGGTANVTTDAQMCIGAIYSLGAGTNYLLGDTFLRNVYTVLRSGSTPAIGLARLANGAPEPNPSAAPSKTIIAVPATVLAAVVIAWVTIFA